MKIKCLFLKTLFIVALLAPPCSRISAQPVYSSSIVDKVIKTISTAEPWNTVLNIECSSNQTK